MRIRILLLSLSSKFRKKKKNTYSSNNSQHVSREHDIPASEYVAERARDAKRGRGRDRPSGRNPTDTSRVAQVRSNLSNDRSRENEPERQRAREREREKLFSEVISISASDFS